MDFFLTFCTCSLLHTLYQQIVDYLRVLTHVPSSAILIYKHTYISIPGLIYQIWIFIVHGAILPDVDTQLN